VLSTRVNAEVDEWEEMSQKNATGYQEIGKQVVTVMSQAALVKSRLDGLLTRDPKGTSYIVDTSNFNPFILPEQLKQVGPNCVLYAIFHLLNAKGITLSQEEVDQIVKKYRGSFPGNLGMGIPLSAVEEILREKNISFEKNELNFFQQIESGLNSGEQSGLTYDASSLKDKLIDNLKNGNPVYVATDCEIFGYNDGQAGHAFTVLGANVDEKGNLISVVVDTNWGTDTTPPEPILRTISGDAFLHDWVQKGGYMLAIK
jgi:hypothetical protein